MVKILFKVLATVVGAAVAFRIGLAITALALERWYLLHIMKQYPRDTFFVTIKGFGPAALGAWMCAALVLYLGFSSTARTIRRSKLPPDSNP